MSKDIIHLSSWKAVFYLLTDIVEWYMKYSYHEIKTIISLKCIQVTFVVMWHYINKINYTDTLLTTTVMLSLLCLGAL